MAVIFVQLARVILSFFSSSLSFGFDEVRLRCALLHCVSGVDSSRSLRLEVKATCALAYEAVLDYTIWDHDR